MNSVFFEITDVSAPLASGVEGKIQSEPMIECPANPSHRRGGRSIPPLHIAINLSEHPDFLWTVYSDCIVSHRVVELLAKENIHSYMTRPVVLYDNKSRVQIQDPPYQELVVTGWGGIAPEESGVKLVTKCEHCKLLRYSGYTHPEKLVDLQQWDGSDIFLVWPMPRFRFVTKRIKTLFEANKVSGVSFVPLGEMKVSRTMKLAPGRLSDWMPLQRAKELGDRYDIT